MNSKVCLSKNLPVFAHACAGRYIVSMQNVTAQGGALNQACADDHKEQPWMCFMAPHMQSYIQTPWCMLSPLTQTPTLCSESTHTTSGTCSTPSSIHGSWPTSCKRPGPPQHSKPPSSPTAPTSCSNSNPLQPSKKTAHSSLPAYATAALGPASSWTA